MTREEAIKRINDIRKSYARYVEIVTENENEAFNMAIKALEPKTIQEIQAESEKYQKAFEDGYEQGYAQARFDYEQEPCEDAISRQAVNILVDELARAISDERCCMSRGRSTASIMQDILDLPSVKPQEPILDKIRAEVEALNQDYESEDSK